jgi:hypothetical protein
MPTSKAAGEVNVVGLHQTLGFVESTFKMKGGKIKSVKIHTTNEVVQGEITEVAPCKESNKNSGTACASVIALLEGGTLTSLHESTVTLKVTGQPEVITPISFTPTFTVEVITGNLKEKA